MNKMNNKLANRNGQLREIISLKGVLASVSPRVWVIAFPIASVNDLANSLVFEPLAILKNRRSVWSERAKTIKLCAKDPPPDQCKPRVSYVIWRAECSEIILVIWYNQIKSWQEIGYLL